MIYVRKEGENVRNGFNFYSLKDKDSFGAVIRMHKLIVYIRYSKTCNKWFFQFYKAHLEPDIFE